MNKKNLILNPKLNNKQLIVILKPDGYFEVDWQEINGHISSEEMSKREDHYKNFQIDPFRELLILGLTEKRMTISEPLCYLRTIALLFVRKLSKRLDLEMIRDRISVQLEEWEINMFLEKAPYLIGEEYLCKAWIRDFWKKINSAYNNMIRLYTGSVKSFLEKHNPHMHLVGRLFFHLEESEDDENPFEFYVTYSGYINENGIVKHLPLKNIIVEYDKDIKRRDELLQPIKKVSYGSSFISRLFDTGEIFTSISMNPQEAYVFLKEIPIYEKAGITCKIPNWWKNKAETLKMSITVGNNTIRSVNFAAIVDFDTNLYLGGEKIKAVELEKLLDETEGLAFVKGKWIEVNHKMLHEMLKAYENAQKILNTDELNIIDAMKIQLNIEKKLNVQKDMFEIEVKNGAWIDSIVTQLTRPEKIEDIDCGDGFAGKLRNYQSKGLNWLYFMKNIGLGACLADDMGLGKTIQAIALLNQCKDRKKGKSLIVVPVSLIGNWMNEIDMNAPTLRYCILHASENKNFVEDMNFLEDYDVYITSYGMLSKYNQFTDVKWDTVILDEAQAIKNPRTIRTRQVKKLNANFKVAMTGTPIENKLTDLWSIFDFLNKGLLGTTKEFSEFTKNLEEHHVDYGRLKHIVSPFILRRLKTDKKIISDLPEKIEMKTYSNLSRKQVLLYDELVKDLKIRFETSEGGIQRRGLVLSAIMKFKQICNHPDQYLKKSNYLEKESGKFERLREICEVIYKKRERVIIFTQFREITEPLKNFLEGVFKHEGLVIHGGTPIKKRNEIVEKFQGGHEYVPFMVLSIKAGGVGLNLTSANHVIHFDRWWNPSIENQATDRAFRIGQMKNVVVHKFIMKGTIEEKIDLMIEDKIKMSKEIISNNQIDLISKMDNEQLMDLFSLKI
ncbi:MAG: DEAD/DEAH box helicase [Clostridiales bacterium]|nr:DEAD/DEAH box helicase [Clostridiales bacterium]